MIYFDRKTLSMLKYIKRCSKNGASWDKLQKRYGADIANPFQLQEFSKELYTITQNHDGVWLDHAELNNADYNFRSFITPKGNELIEQKRFNFWKWVIPTLISVAALIVSVLALLSK